MKNRAKKHTKKSLDASVEKNFAKTIKHTLLNESAPSKNGKRFPIKRAPKFDKKTVDKFMRHVKDVVAPAQMSGLDAADQGPRRECRRDELQRHRRASHLQGLLDHDGQNTLRHHLLRHPPRDRGQRPGWY